MYRMSVSLTILASLLSVGCGTFLSVRQATVEQEKVPGVAVNQRATMGYTVKSEGGGVTLSGSLNGTIKGVDPHYVTTVNTRRMPFASGKLVVKLNGEQLLKEVTLTSDTGAVRAAQAADTVLQKYIEIEKLRAAEP